MSILTHESMARGVFEAEESWTEHAQTKPKTPTRGSGGAIQIKPQVKNARGSLLDQENLLQLLGQRASDEGGVWVHHLKERH